jgi:hypothetical protein
MVQLVATPAIVVVVELKFGKAVPVVTANVGPV